MSRTKNALHLIGALAVAGGAAPALAQESYPSKPVRMIIPFPPGGSNDIVGRMVAAQLSDRLGRQVVVDNRGGAGGVVGADLAAKATPDGHTLLIISVAYVFNTWLYKLPYDPIKSFVPIGTIGSGPNVLTVFPGLPVQSVKELIALARDKPGQLNYASAGVGSFQHLGSELFRITAGIKVVHVPFKGGGPATIDVIGGQSQFSLGSLNQSLPHIKSGRLRALGTGGPKRTSILPDVPTIAEAGLPGYEATNWWGLLTTAGTPAPVVDRLRKELATVLTSAETQKRMQSEGSEVLQMEPARFSRFIETETAKWGRVVKEAGIKGE
jgi:tripartite-type tricarboxylate transporter receptor subunit TctC